MNHNDLFWMEFIKKGKIKADAETGKVFSCLSGEWQEIGSLTELGYLRCNTYGRGRRRRVMAHRLVWIYFNGEIPDGKEINHKNGVHIDNRLCNLELVTHAENMRHAREILGLVSFHHQSGENSYNHKLNFRWASQIRSEYSAGNISQRQLAQKHHLSQGTINLIVRGLRWLS